MDYSIVILNYKNPDLTLKCIESIQKYHKIKTYEILLINNSPEDYNFLEKKLKKYNNISIISPQCNTYFITGVSIWVKKAKGKYIALVNNDWYFEDNSLEKMLNFLENAPTYWGVTWQIIDLKTRKVSRTANWKPSFLSEAVHMTLFWWTLKQINWLPSFYKRYLYSWRDRKTDKNVFSWCNAYFMFNKKIFNLIWGYDLNLLLYYSEYDFWFKLEKIGLKTKYLKTTTLFHEWWDSTGRQKNWKINAILLHDRYQIFKKRYGAIVSGVLLFLTILFNPYILKELPQVLKYISQLTKEVRNNQDILMNI